MNNALKLLIGCGLIAGPLLLQAQPVGAAPRVGPMGPSARMAARLKKYPTSNWLAHYLPDDRYKIAGNVWKFVSTDLDTYYHRPDSPLMLRQPASRVIGFASTKEAEEAGYRPGPSVDTMGGGSAGYGGMAGGNSKANQQMKKALAALAELQTLGAQARSDKTRNLPLLRQRLARALVLFNDLPVKPSERKQASGVKMLLRGLIKTIDYQIAGNSTAAQQQLSASVGAFRTMTR